MSSIKIDMRHEGLQLSLQIEDRSLSDRQHDSHLFVRAVEALIESADTDFWEKNESAITPQEFYARVLRAVAHHYAVGWPVEEGDANTVATTLARLIDDLRADGRLGEQIEFPDDEDNLE